jgi:acetoacetyl-CoA synthetase
MLTYGQPFGDMFPSPKFFPGSLMNFAENVFRGRDPSRTAIIEATEGSLETISITWGELQTQVEKLADALRASGVQKGDRVAAVIATTGLAISLCLATLSIGAIWSSISPDFGTKGILDRLLQIDAKLIFTDISVVYNGKNRDLADTISEWGKVASGGSSLKNVVLNTPHPAISSKILKAIDLSAFLSRGIGRKLQFEQVPFSHPGFIFYSSGTVQSIF